jgi:glycine/D-amino acid oxidase-like deaminating enzyme
VRALWGVTVQVAFDQPPRYRIEEWDDAGDDLDIPSIFEVTPLDDVSVLGATRAAAEPDPDAIGPTVVDRAARFLPAVQTARTVAVRACPRPVSVDDVPLLGPLPHAEGLHVAVGHGAYGITLGPASARLAADALLHGTPVPLEFAADRLGVPA